MTLEQFSALIAQSIWQRSAACRRIFCGMNEGDIAPFLYEHCLSDFGEAPSKVIFLGVSAGFAIGVELESGGRVVIKFHSGLGLRHLSRAYHIQERLREAGLPCARLMRAPAELRPGLVTVSHALFAPGTQAKLNPAVRTSVAETHAFIISLTSDLDASGLAAPIADFSSAVFDDFKNLREDLEGVWAESRAVIAHTDLKIRNLMFEGNRVSAVYDFEALHVVPEHYTIAATAISFMRRRGPLTIDLMPAETYAFLRDYERLRGRAFPSDEVRCLRLWTLYDAITRTNMRPFRNVPPQFLVDRIARFDQAIADLWPVWRKAGRG